MELPEIFAAEKDLVSATEWIERDAARKSVLLTLIGGLEIDGVTLAGLRLRATAIRSLPDRAVTFQLEYHPPRQHGSALSRVEWNPIKPHNNKGNGPPELRFVEQKGSHYHPFELNWNAAASQLRRGNLPIAIPITAPMRSFADVLVFVGEEFRINGLERLSPPEWEPRLV